MLKELLKGKIERSIEEDKAIAISVSNRFTECRNTVYLDGYEMEGDNLSLIAGNFELHINLSDITGIVQDDIYVDKFLIVDKGTDTEIEMCFLN